MSFPSMSGTRISTDDAIEGINNVGRAFYLEDVVMEAELRQEASAFLVVLVDDGFDIDFRKVPVQPGKEGGEDLIGIASSLAFLADEIA